MIKPLAGTVLVDPKFESETIILSGKSNSRLMKGKVIEVGAPYISDSGIEITTPLKKGETVYFLSYEGDYDNITEKGKQYYFVQFRDLRGYGTI